MDAPPIDSAEPLTPIVVANDPPDDLLAGGFVAVSIERDCRPRGRGSIQNAVS